MSVCVYVCMEIAQTHVYVLTVASLPRWHRFCLVFRSFGSSPARSSIGLHLIPMEFQCSLSIEIGHGMTIRGPRSSSDSAPLLVWPPPIEGTDGKLYFRVSTTSDWLCRFLTGVRVGVRPLGRFQCWDILKAAMFQAEQDAASLKQSVTSGIADTTTGKRRKVKRCSENDPLEIHVPKSPTNGELTILSAVRKHRCVHLELGQASFSWLLAWCEGQASKPKRTFPLPTADEFAPNPRFFFRKA